MTVLVVNAGSSTQKCSLYDLAPDATPPPGPPRWEAMIDWADAHGPALTARSAGGSVRSQLNSGDRDGALRQLFATLVEGPARVLGAYDEIAIAGHRIVHGGATFENPVIVDDAVVDAIRALSPLAPTHNPAALEAIALVRTLMPRVPQAAAFDTAFHRTMPRAATTYPGPYAWLERGIRRFGFHGISYSYLALRVPQLVGRDTAGLRIVACHLGNGASVAAIVDGKSVDTTMGFTPLEGVVMGTRSGSVDPGIVLFLMREGNDAAALDDVLEKQSGLLGMSGVSADMRAVIAAEAAGNDRAALALEVYVHRLAAAIAAMTASLRGIDVLAFSGGIGQHAALVRERVCERLPHLGLTIDPERNRAGISGDYAVEAAGAPTSIVVIEAQEDWMIARSCSALVLVGN